jgi:hypothetical protein
VCVGLPLSYSLSWKPATQFPVSLPLIMAGEPQLSVELASRRLGISRNERITCQN